MDQSLQSVLLIACVGVVPFSAVIALGVSLKVIQRSVIKSVIRILVSISTMRSERKVRGKVMKFCWKLALCVVLWRLLRPDGTLHFG
eukprot:5249960-Amphidinium_carterae.1